MGARARLLFGAGVVDCLMDAPVSGQPAELEVILARASRYVGEFVYRFSNVVAEEGYLQETQREDTFTAVGARRVS
jgi:hypothetical protein